MYPSVLFRRAGTALRWMACAAALPLVAARAADPPTETPGSATPLAWIRFDDGPETYASRPYYWLGRVDLAVHVAVEPAPGRRLELLWGCKNDDREATLIANGVSIPVQAGGYDGYRWLRVPLPADLKGPAYELRLTRSGDKPAFLAEIRLVDDTVPSIPPDLSVPARKMKRSLLPPALPEAFPEMRAQWDQPMPLPAGLDPASEPQFRQAEANGRRATEMFFRCRKFVEGWLAHADPVTGLIPRNLTDSRDIWNAKDSAADNYPFMVLSAALTDRALFDGRMRAMLATETRLTSRIDRLPDTWRFSRQAFETAEPNLQDVLFGGAEYVKDGLLPLTEWLGTSP